MRCKATKESLSEAEYSNRNRRAESPVDHLQPCVWLYSLKCRYMFGLGIWQCSSPIGMGVSGSGGRIAAPPKVNSTVVSIFVLLTSLPIRFLLDGVNHQLEQRSLMVATITRSNDHQFQPHLPQGILHDTSSLYTNYYNCLLTAIKRTTRNLHRVVQQWQNTYQF
ncbi:hypothetical protein ASPBRDRAFT_585597 [Aspergillus brasiliensis CBS 101740]|uniref:Uncharacterized protein n=1 Tax=Aspergillus brasiliensis (strain CBS 101740 / IMI 381727 / IBT 21946) TaxID=767769 RepID=A0A1L9UK20_ASPBC|nr:hypothetical protein ASPBRDRAFT_585597 [Aspergillus brasiliensis CBS 101740]